ncbi:MAG: poly(3-hydroxybutyrate) depolymerase, partial [Pseudomonadota bacterium]
MLDNTVVPLPGYKTKKQNSVSGLSSGAFMTVQLHIAHSSSFVGAGVIAGGPYRAAETFRSAPTVPMSNILTSLYVAMTPLTAATAPDVDRLLDLAQDTENIDELKNLKGQRLYLFTGSRDQVVNQHAVRSTKAFYEGLGLAGSALKFVDD